MPYLPETFWLSVRVQAIAPEVVYTGMFPRRASDYYAVGQGGMQYVYLLFDEDEVLLYVGRSHRPGNRFDKHRRHQPWWPSVSGLLILAVNGETKAEAAALVAGLELHCIRRLGPQYNVSGVAV